MHVVIWDVLLHTVGVDGGGWGRDAEDHELVLVVYLQVPLIFSLNHLLLLLFFNRCVGVCLADLKFRLRSARLICVYFAERLDG